MIVFAVNIIPYDNACSKHNGKMCQIFLSHPIFIINFLHDRIDFSDGALLKMDSIIIKRKDIFAIFVFSSMHPQGHTNQ